VDNPDNPDEEDNYQPDNTDIAEARDTAIFELYKTIAAGAQVAGEEIVKMDGEGVIASLGNLTATLITLLNAPDGYEDSEELTPLVSTAGTAADNTAILSTLIAHLIAREKVLTAQLARIRLCALPLVSRQSPDREELGGVLSKLHAALVWEPGAESVIISQGEPGHGPESEH
jgi:hypothetical protein